MTSFDAFYLRGMRLALAEAQKAYDEGEVPNGCVILPAPPDLLETLPQPPTGAGTPALDPNRTLPPRLGLAHNQTESLCDPTAHAEMIAITQASSALGDWRLSNTVLFTTKEPCPMCAGAIVLARIPIVVYGLSDPKRGGQSAFGILHHPNLIHRTHIVSGILEEECHEQFSRFFRERRAGLIGKKNTTPYEDGNP